MDASEPSVGQRERERPERRGWVERRRRKREEESWAGCELGARATEKGRGERRESERVAGWRNRESGNGGGGWRPGRQGRFIEQRGRTVEKILTEISGFAATFFSSNRDSPTVEEEIIRRDGRRLPARSKSAGPG